MKLPLPPFQAEIAAEILTSVTREEVLKTGIKNAVIGLSGGIDSALSLLLAVNALGKENVHAVMMPYSGSSPDSLNHARLLVEQTGVSSTVEEITDMVDPYFARHNEISRLQKGNVMARMRMIILYDYSVQKNALVIGTSNKTEWLLGYSTLWGDMASAVNPLGDLYKSQVSSLSRHLHMPSEIVEKAPSADLWEGQSDEDELQLTYDEADRILYHRIDLCWSPERVLQTAVDDGISEEKVSRVLKMVTGSQYKRKFPVIAKVSKRTIDREFRYPRDWNL